MEVPNPNSQVKFLNKTILNITTNFVPRWVTRYIQNLLRKQKKFYKRYRLNGFKADDKVIVDRIREECFQAIKTSKENDLKSLGDNLIDKTTGPETYWSIINSLLIKLIVADKIIIDCKEKAKLFSDYFLDQCKPVINDSTLPKSSSNLDTIAISQQSNLDIIKSLNVNKAHGPDNISGRMNVSL